MALLSKFKIKPKLEPEVPPNRAHPLEAIPIRSENVDQRRSESGELQLLGKFPQTGLFGRLLPKSEKTVQVALDERGSFFWSLIDGKRDLFEISERLESRFKLEESESRNAAILFVKMLMRRGFIRLKFHPVRGAQSIIEDKEEDKS
jgi:hypothetical protein